MSGTTVGLAALVSIPHTALKTLVVWGMIVVGVPAATVGFVVAVVNARATAIVEFNSRKVQDDFQRDRSSTVTTSSVELKLDDSIKSRQRAASTKCRSTACTLPRNPPHIDQSRKWKLENGTKCRRLLCVCSSLRPPSR